MLNGASAASRFNQPISDTGETPSRMGLPLNVNRMSCREDACERNVTAGKRDYAVNGRDHAVNGLALRRGSLLISIPFYGE
jgi:hypothetical protein